MDQDMPDELVPEIGQTQTSTTSILDSYPRIVANININTNSV